MARRVVTNPDSRLLASIQVPGDKSLSHRALIFAAISEGDSLITGLGSGEDVRRTIEAIRALGVLVDGPEIRSPGSSNWTEPSAPIDCGNSGTTMRLLAGVLSTSEVQATLVGDKSLSARPMNRLVAPLEALGGRITPSSGGTAPISVGGATDVQGTSFAIDIASAQIRSAFELAALAAPISSVIDSPPGFRDHTERWLIAAGLGEWSTATAFRVDPGTLAPARYDVPGDPSSAAYLWAVAAIHRGSEVLTPNISLNPGRLGFLQVLEEMGTEVEALVTGSIGGDPVGDVKVTGRTLRAVDVGGDLVASTLDELPLLAVVATFAEGITTVSNAEELRAKESDRIASTTAMIQALDGAIEPATDGFQVVGTGFLGGGEVDSLGDHRIAMAAAVAGLRADGPVEIVGAECAAVSWPAFYDTLEEMW
ncbi:MAG: 3-phosphoshikimate 1-carboxyvinyltransferase [Actinomycetia bacterium]|nr:3-phosphoshikimate 1-carboxyvinyltransferase [Actinomycetes bacterium]